MEALDTILAFTVARKRVTKLVERSIRIATTWLTAIRIGVVKKLEAVVTAVTRKPWKQNGRKSFSKNAKDHY